MASRDTAPEAIASLAERSLRGQARRPSPLSIRHDMCPERAGDDLLAAEVPVEKRDVVVGEKRGRPNEVAVGDGLAATTSGDRHVEDDCTEGADTISQSCMRLIPT